MKVDVTIARGITDAPEEAAALERDGYDGIWVGEGGHDPFLHVLQVANAARQPVVGTSIAVAFARSPMTVAMSAYDLAAYSRGRFVLGLGSQVKPHIERRFSMPWSRPAARMREYVLALRAIWATWQDGAPLDFRGEFYSHTLMSPFFSPTRHEWGPPPVHVAGVGERMTEAAGEVADGFFVHPFTTVRFLEEVTLPALRRGRLTAGRDDLQGFVLNAPAFIATGRDDEEVALAVRKTRERIAFYASTPAYRPVLELHDRADLGPRLTELSKAGRWQEMGDLVDDELLDLMAVVGEPEAAGQALVDRWGGHYDRLSLYTGYDLHADAARAVVAAMRAATA